MKLILKRDGTLVLRMRDNGAAFNPMDLDLSAADPCSAVGIRMLRQGVREVEYQNTVGLNNVVVTLPAPRERDLAFRKPYRVRRASDACEAPYLTCGPINAGVLSWNAGIFSQFTFWNVSKTE